MAKKTKAKREDRDTTVLTISKGDLAHFNELRAREAGRRGVTNITQQDYIRFLLAVYMQVGDRAILNAAMESAGVGKKREEKK